MFKKNFISYLASFSLIAVVIFGASSSKIEHVFAAALTTLSDTQSSVKVSALSDHTFQFVTPSGVIAGGTISITFPVGWTIGSLATTSVDFATSTSASCSGFTDALISNNASGLTWGVATTTSVITFTSGTAVIPANRCIQIRIGSNAVSQGTGTTTIINPASATSSVIVIGGTFGDTGLITANIITDDTVAMTGTVNQSLSFTISTTTIYFGALGSAGPKFASSTNPLGDSNETIAHSLAVGTNAPSGFTLSVRGQTLTSQQNALNTITAVGGSPAANATGTEQFGLRATESGGVGTVVSSPFATANQYGYSSTATTSAVLATGSGSTPTSTYSLRYVANIAAVTEAGTYAANLVYVATANF